MTIESLVQYVAAEGRQQDTSAVELPPVDEPKVEPVAWADEQIERAENAIWQDYYGNSLPAGRVPRFLVPESALMNHNLTHQEGFVASRINGTWDVRSIVMLSPLREIEIPQVLDKLMKLNLLALK